MMRRALVVAALALSAAASLQAQAPSRLGVGDRVKLVTRAGRRVIGIVAALEQDSVRLRQGTRLMTAVPVADVATFRTSSGPDRWRGAGWGALAGAVVGATLVVCGLYADSRGDITLSSTAVTGPAAVLLTGVGAGIARWWHPIAGLPRGRSAWVPHGRRAGNPCVWHDRAVLRQPRPPGPPHPTRCCSKQSDLAIRAGSE